ncbi:MAG: hypothetical protein ACYDAD_13955, partial [Acidimicrobiales bacterium]
MDDRHPEDREDGPSLDEPGTGRARRPSHEGVRIIGAEEAAAAIETGQVASRRPDDVPRFGDVPEPPPGPRPPLRFPLADDEDPAAVVQRAPVVSSARSDLPPGATLPASGPSAPGGVGNGPGRGSGPTPGTRTRPGAPPMGLSGPSPAVLPHWTEPATGEV